MNRYAVAHTLSAAADALVAVSLAGSLFFSISPDASRQQVLLYLVINMAPFALLAPLIGPAIDRFQGSHRVIAMALFIARAVLAAGMALFLLDLTLYFFALALLVAGKAYGVTKQAIVPGLVTSPRQLVSANSRLARLSLIGGSVVGGGGAAVLALTSAKVTLAVACVIFVVAGVVVTTVPVPKPVVDELAPEAEFLSLHSPMISSASWAFTVIRAAVGFFVFGLAFALRRDSEPAYMYGLAAGAYATGTFAGNALAPALRRRTSDDRLTAGSLLALAVVATFGALGPSQTLVVLVAGVLGAAAAIGRQGFDALIQTRAPLTSRGRAFARFETRFQLAWVGGAVAATAIAIPIRVSMAVVACGLVPVGLLYLRTVRETREVMADDAFHPIAISRRRIEQLTSPERHARPRIAAIELASVADLARAADLPIDQGLVDFVDRLRNQACHGREPAAGELDAAIAQMVTAVAGFHGLPATRRPSDPPHPRPTISSSEA